MQLKERIKNHPDHILIKREGEPGPVCACAQFLHLLSRHTLVFLDVIPNHPEEAFPVIVHPAFSLFLEFLFKHKLSFDSGMIGSGKPEASPAAHALVANENVLNGHK